MGSNTTFLLRAGALGAALAAALGTTAVLAAPNDEAKALDPEIEYTRYRLDNGLEVILHRDTSVPLVAVSVWYHVGAGDETPGKSGFAHLFEHMLFQGSKHVGEDNHFDTLKRIGASSVNGTTNFDRTNYYEVVPSNQLETALWLESDRMGFLLPLLSQQSLDNQIAVVRNERRRSVDNVPYGPSSLRMFELLYPEGHAYRFRVIGRHEDLESASLDDVRKFYETWYTPANATLTLSGDFEIDTARALVNRWFGSLPTAERTRQKVPPPPALEATVRESVSDDFAKLRRLVYAWHSPAAFADGDAELTILADALARTGPGRLYRRLVHEEQLAQSVSAYQRGSQHSGVFVIAVTLRSDADLARAEAIVNEELERITTEPITQREHARAVVNREAGFIWGLESLLQRAEALQRYNHYLGTPDAISRDLDRYRQSSPAKVLAAAKSVLSKPRVELVTVPSSQGGN